MENIINQQIKAFVDETDGIADGSNRCTDELGAARSRKRRANRNAKRRTEDHDTGGQTDGNFSLADTV